MIHANKMPQAGSLPHDLKQDNPIKHTEGQTDSPNPPTKLLSQLIQTLDFYFNPDQHQLTLLFIEICRDEQALITQLVQWPCICYKEAIQEGKPVRSHLIPLEERWSLRSERNMDAYHISTKRWRQENGSSTPQLYRKFRASLGYMRSCL